LTLSLSIKHPLGRSAQSGRSLLTTDKNVARAYRFAIKAGIGRCPQILQRLILPAGLLLYLETTTKLLKILGEFSAFFQMRLEIVE
jgi:hypothetical protein